VSKFTIKVELQGLKIEVEGSREDVPRLAQRVGDQIGNLVKPALLLEGAKVTQAASNGDETGAETRRSRVRRAGGSGGGRTPSAPIGVSIDPVKHGSPRQDWKTAQKAIWFLYVVQDNNADGLTATAVAKAFNKHFKAAGMLNSGNVSRDLEKERLKGVGATVVADTNDGPAKYTLTEAGVRMAEKLIRGESAAATA
jgi:hypothetical protein